VLFLIVISAILSYFAPAHPIFYVFSVLVAALGVFVAWITGNVANAFVESLGTIPSPAEPLYTIVVANLPVLAVINFILVSIAAYGGLKDLMSRGG